jgi:outer membrane immunogenic protein
MKRQLSALAAALCLVSAGEAMADGNARRGAAAASVPSSWTGFYIGIGGGSGAVVHDLSLDVLGAVNVLSFDGIGGEGAFGTVLVGLDYQIHPAIVMGVFADYDLSGISTDVSAFGGLFTSTLEHKHSWSIGGRLGLLTSPRTLWYGTLGYTQAEFDLTSTIGSLDIPEFRGYFVGGGVESQLGGGFALRAEYRYTQFDSETLFSIPGILDLSLEPSMHTARVTVSYKFSRGEEARAPLK